MLVFDLCRCLAVILPFTSATCVYSMLFTCFYSQLADPAALGIKHDSQLSNQSASAHACFKKILSCTCAFCSYVDHVYLFRFLPCWNMDAHGVHSNLTLPSGSISDSEQLFWEELGL